MAIQIEDGKGSGSLVGVFNNKLETTARTNPRIAYISRDDGNSFSWSHSYDHDAGDTILLVSNSSTTLKLYIHTISVGADTATEFTVHSPAYPTLAGTAITAVNLNRTIGKSASAQAYGDETGNTQANVLFRGFVGGNATIILPPNGTIILGYHQCIAVDLVTAGTKGAVTLTGYYE